MKPVWKQALALAMCGWVWVCQADTLRGQVVGLWPPSTASVELSFGADIGLGLTFVQRVGVVNMEDTRC